MTDNEQEICEMCESGWRSVDGMTDLELMPGVVKRICIHCKADWDLNEKKIMASGGYSEYFKRNYRKKPSFVSRLVRAFVIGLVIFLALAFILSLVRF